MEGINEIVKQHLKRQYENACNAYLIELANMWDLDCKSYDFWIGDDVGGTFSYGDTGLFIDMDNIRYCVINNVSYSEYRDWLDYCVWAADFDQNVPNLKAWHDGCPRVDVVTQEKLSAMRYEMIKMCEELKEKF